MTEKQDLYFGLAEVDRNYSGEELLEIARISDGKTGKILMRVFYDKYLYKSSNLHIAVQVSNDAEYGRMPYTFVDDEHKACLYEDTNVFVALLFHEYGHFQNGDLDNVPSTTTSDDIRHQRIDLISKGQVTESELKADAFAVQYVGKNTMLRALNYLINKRKQRKDDPGKELAIKEFQLRSKAIQRLRI